MINSKISDCDFEGPDNQTSEKYVSIVMINGAMWNKDQTVLIDGKHHLKSDVVKFKGIVMLKSDLPELSYEKFTKWLTKKNFGITANIDNYSTYDAIVIKNNNSLHITFSENKEVFIYHTREKYTSYIEAKIAIKKLLKSF